MLSVKQRHAAILAAVIAFSGADLAFGQTSPDMTDGMAQSEGTAPCGYGTMPRGMMGMNMMRPGMMSGMPMAMRGHMMQIMFAIADTNGDGALSFDEVMAIHKRIFDLVDANKDGKVTIEEMQAFMHQ
ncbi:EF-hand domain-containing protein (plasmid) [Rhizobium sp. CB3090]|uniref:EF-hand domain-containing protein n=1 Tax=Rhizobium sp. CB3090 TaxID=3039156 RepID=UPI0024B25D25|nr:EF-hand domain-containing protein [Rhizobium sp. CB3090]WFU13246.1 EF-hand domain-containing protein [Rhizobium sp. CB3090]